MRIKAPLRPSDVLHSVRLIACHNCHTQFDVSQVVEKEFPCRCGEMLENKPLQAVDAAIHRCGSCGAHVGAEAEGCDYCGAAIVRDARQLGLICPECYGRNADDSRFCTACGVAFRPEPVQPQGYELPCPVCGGLMPTRPVAGLAVNECPSCHGIWAPEDKFDLLVTKAMQARKNTPPEERFQLNPRVAGANPARQQVVYRKCPVCEAFMQRRNFRKASGVIIDRCAEHGTWLDADELEQIAGFILSGGRPEAEAHLREQEARDEAEYRKAAATRAVSQSIHAMRGPVSARSAASFSFFEMLSELLD